MNENPDNIGVEDIDSTRITKATFQLHFEMDIKFWSILPILNYNAHAREVEIGWLCFGLYISKKL